MGFYGFRVEVQIGWRESPTRNKAKAMMEYAEHKKAKLKAYNKGWAVRMQNERRRC